MITELRFYRIKPDHLDAWLAAFGEVVRESERHGIRIEYAGVDRETSTFTWLRSFRDEEDRVARKAAFYGSQWWLAREAATMDHVVDYAVTFLDASHIQASGRVEAIDWPATGAPAGSTPDDPPDGWVPSTGRRFVRLRSAGG